MNSPQGPTALLYRDVEVNSSVCPLPPLSRHDQRKELTVFPEFAIALDLIGSMKTCGKCAVWQAMGTQDRREETGFGVVCTGLKVPQGRGHRPHRKSEGCG